MLSLAEVSKHNNASSCWVIINNQVYDVTEFLPQHPGGSSIILKYAGKDATLAYEPIHPPTALKDNLPSSKFLGPVNTEAIATLKSELANKKKTQDEVRVEKALTQRPPLGRILSLADIEAVAKDVLSLKAWSYYSSASDDSVSNLENRRAFSRFFFKPRVMRPVSACDPSTRILGYHSSIPVFASGAALAKLGHPLGEINITKGAAQRSIIQMVSSNASLSPSDIMSAAAPGQPLFFQLYKSGKDDIAEKRVKLVDELGYKAIFLTVDAIVAGKRELDIKSPWVIEHMENIMTYYREGDKHESQSQLGTAGALIAGDDRDMTWEKTIPWLRSKTKLPIVIKGIQCVEDAILAAEAGVDGILLSNHGGRQLDYSLPPLEVLYQLQMQCPSIFTRLEVYIDGGVTRGTDVVKALCLGATAVGLGRPFLYAQSAYGVDGVLRLIDILQDEIKTAMQLIGAASVRDLSPSMVQRVDWQPIATSKL